MSRGNARIRRGLGPQGRDPDYWITAGQLLGLKTRRRGGRNRSAGFVQHGSHQGSPESMPRQAAGQGRAAALERRWNDAGNPVNQMTACQSAGEGLSRSLLNFGWRTPCSSCAAYVAAPPSGRGAARSASPRVPPRWTPPRRGGRAPTTRPAAPAPAPGAFPISRSRAHTHRRHGHPLQTVPSAGLIERPQEKNRVDALR